MGKHFPHSNEGIIRLGPLDLSDPRVFYHDEDKFPIPALRGFKCHVVAAPGLVYRLLLGADLCLLIVINQRVVNSGLAWLGERGGLVRRVGCRILYDPDKFMHPVFLVIWDDEEDLLQNLTEL